MTNKIWWIISNYDTKTKIISICISQEKYWNTSRGKEKWNTMCSASLLAQKNIADLIVGASPAWTWMITSIYIWQILTSSPGRNLIRNRCVYDYQVVVHLQNHTSISSVKRQIVTLQQLKNLPQSMKQHVDLNTNQNIGLLFVCSISMALVLYHWKSPSN